MYKLANPSNQKEITWSDDELKFIFVKLLEYATDLPLRYFEVFTPDIASNQQPGQEDLFSIQEIINDEFQPIQELDDKYAEFYDEWLIDHLFPENESKTNMTKFVNNLSQNQDMKEFFNPDFMRKRVLDSIQ